MSAECTIAPQQILDLPSLTYMNASQLVIVIVSMVYYWLAHQPSIHMTPALLEIYMTLAPLASEDLKLVCHGVCAFAVVAACMSNALVVIQAVG